MHAHKKHHFVFLRRLSLSPLHHLWTSLGGFGLASFQGFSVRPWQFGRQSIASDRMAAATSLRVTALPNAKVYDPDATIQSVFGDLKGRVLLDAIWNVYQAGPETLELENNDSLLQFATCGFWCAFDSKLGQYLV